MTERSKIFLSFAASDREIAYKFRQRIFKSGDLMSFDITDLEPSDQWVSSLRSKIAAADIFLLFLSPDALASKWVQHDLEYVTSKELRQRLVTLVPIKVRPCTVPDYLASWLVIDGTKDIDRAVERVASLVELAPSVQIERLNPRDFESFIKDLMGAYGFKKIQSQNIGRDFGFDFKAETALRDPFGRIETVNWIVEARSHASKPDVAALQTLLGAMSIRGERGLFITANQLTSPAKEWLQRVTSNRQLQVTIIEGAELKRLALEKPKVIAKYFRKVP